VYSIVCKKNIYFNYFSFLLSNFVLKMSKFTCKKKRLPHTGPILCESMNMTGPHESYNGIGPAHRCYYNRHGPYVSSSSSSVSLVSVLYFELRLPSSLSLSPSDRARHCYLLGGGTEGDDRAGPPHGRFGFSARIPSRPLPQAVKFNPHRRRGATEPRSLASTATR
jgi:hypothetical protein